MTDEEFNARYEALKADLMRAWELHSRGVPADERGWRGQLLGGITSSAAKLIAREVGAEQCHALFAAMGDFHKQALEALLASRGRRAH